MNKERRKFIKKCAMGGCGVALGVYTINDLLKGGDYGLRMGFRNDAPRELGPCSIEAAWYESGTMPSSTVHCQLCPHECLLGENDRGFCRSRVVKKGKLYSIAYGNPCAVHIDPIEKKPMAHFLPGTPIFSLAVAGCNLRCLNCQNWEISQQKPDTTENIDLPPERLVGITLAQAIPSIAYTYSEPLIFYEYVRDTARLAREHKIRNILVTAGYILEKPCEELCQWIDGANVDIKAFNESTYKKLCQATLKPVLRALEVMRKAGVWIEITWLIVPGFSDDLKEIRTMCKWICSNLGKDTPVHFSRFHADYKLPFLPPTSSETLYAARETARAEGLNFVYVGNLPGCQGQDTLCPNCHKPVIRREGFQVLENLLQKGHCPCGASIAGVWS
jgi:pyruvate formate lyase activating enzyme